MNGHDSLVLDLTAGIRYSTISTNVLTQRTRRTGPGRPHHTRAGLVDVFLLWALSYALFSLPLFLHRDFLPSLSSAAVTSPPCTHLNARNHRSLTHKCLICTCHKKCYGYSTRIVDTVSKALPFLRLRIHSFSGASRLPYFSFGMY